MCAEQLGNLLFNQLDEICRKYLWGNRNFEGVQYFSLG